MKKYHKNSTPGFNVWQGYVSSISSLLIALLMLMGILGSSGDKIDISDLLSGLGYRSGLVLADWVSFTQASGSIPAEINIDTGAGTSVIQKIILDSANLGTNTSLQNLLDNRVLLT